MFVNLSLKDIEEDLDLLDLKKSHSSKNHLNGHSDQSIAYKKRIVELEAKQEELIEMVAKLR